MIRSIFRKHLRDAIRDSRVLVAVLVPIAIGIFYNFLFQDSTPTPSAKVAWYSESGTQLLDTIELVTGETIRLSFVQEQTADDVRTAVGKKEVDGGHAAHVDYPNCAGACRPFRARHTGGSASP